MSNNSEWIIEHKLTDRERLVGTINGETFEVPTQINVVGNAAFIIEHWVSQASLIDSDIPMTDEQREAIRQQFIEWCGDDKFLVVK
jgi:hypothetical protein